MTKNLFTKTALSFAFLLCLFLYGYAKTVPREADRNFGSLPGPTFLHETQIFTDIKNGKEIFDLNCKHCHRLDTEKHGPFLRVTFREVTPQWVYKFVNSPMRTIAEKDPRAEMIYKKWYPTVMTSFKLTQQEIDDVIAYVLTTSPVGKSDSLKVN